MGFIAEPDYSTEAFAYNALTRVSGFHRAPKRLVKVFQEAAGPLKPGAEILDFGCGTGRLSQAFFDAQPALKITGMEPSSGMASRCARRFRGSENFRLVREGYYYDGLPFPDESFDVIAASGVFDHIEITGRAMRDFLQKLKPGGYLAFTFERHGRADKPPSPHSGGDYITHSETYVAKTLQDAGADVQHQSRMIGYVIPFVARFGLVVAQKPVSDGWQTPAIAL